MLQIVEYLYIYLACRTMLGNEVTHSVVVVVAVCKLEYGFAQFAAEYTEDPGSMATGGLYTDVYVGQMVEPFENWCFDETRKPGDTGLVQTNYGYHIMYFVEAREIWVTNVTDTIIYERSLSLVNDAAAKWPLETKYKKIVLSELQLTTAE